MDLRPESDRAERVSLRRTGANLQPKKEAKTRKSPLIGEELSYIKGWEKDLPSFCPSPLL
jgi:hypothetical protein